jgi:molybdopterin synthase sulfur carrier subunit
LKVTVRFFAALREIVGKKEETLEFANEANVTVKRALKELTKLHGKDFADYVYGTKINEVRDYLQMLVNENSATLKTKLKDGDVLVIVPPVGGG